MLKFGAVAAGHTARKTATIVNNSITVVTFKLSFVSSVPELQETKVRSCPLVESLPAGRLACLLRNPLALVAWSSLKQSHLRETRTLHSGQWHSSEVQQGRKREARQGKDEGAARKLTVGSLYNSRER